MSKKSEDHQATRPGGFWIRFLSGLVDCLALSLLSWIGGTLVGKLGGASFLKSIEDPKELMGAQLALGWVIALTIGFFYVGWFCKNKGGTPGKLIFNLKIVDRRTKEFIGYRRAFFREYLGKFLSLIVLCLGFIMVGLRKDKLSLHDIFFGTQVIRKRES
jgi:uncharacterized RDD family membrane protein YckC